MSILELTKGGHGRKANSKQAALQHSCLSPFCRDRKGSEGSKGVRLCMYVCRGGIIDSQPGLKTSLSPSSRFFPVCLSVCPPAFTFTYLLDHFTCTYTLSLPSAVSTSTRQSGRVHPRAAASSCNDPIGSKHLISARVYVPY